MATAKNGPKVGAKTGKVKGTGAVTPKAQETSSEEPKASENDSVQASPAPDAQAQAAQPVDNRASTDEFPEAYEAGWKASAHGTRNRPPLEYSDDEVRAWYRGYKAHANPNAEQPVADIQKGYRENY